MYTKSLDEEFFVVAEPRQRFYIYIFTAVNDVLSMNFPKKPIEKDYDEMMKWYY